MAYPRYRLGNFGVANGISVSKGCVIVAFEDYFL